MLIDNQTVMSIDQKQYLLTYLFRLNWNIEGMEEAIDTASKEMTQLVSSDYSLSINRIKEKTV